LGITIWNIHTKRETPREAFVGLVQCPMLRLGVIGRISVISLMEVLPPISIKPVVDRNGRIVADTNGTIQI
jgi:hypothetical protein